MYIFLEKKAKLFATRHLIWVYTVCHTIYWKSPISILGISGYVMYIILEKKAEYNGLNN